MGCPGPPGLHGTRKCVMRLYAVEPELEQLCSDLGLVSGHCRFVSNLYLSPISLSRVVCVWAQPVFGAPSRMGRKMRFVGPSLTTRRHTSCLTHKAWLSQLLLPPRLAGFLQLVTTQSDKRRFDQSPWTAKAAECAGQPRPDASHWLDHLAQVQHP